MNKKLLGIAVAATATLAVAAWYWSRPAASDKDLILYGNVDLRQVALAFPASERVLRVLAEEGQPVRAGEVLAELDTRSLRLRLAEAEAQAGALQQALARLKAGTRPEEMAQAREVDFRIDVRNRLEPRPSDTEACLDVRLSKRRTQIAS